MAWRKSSFSSNGSACVEVAWRKSSFSSNGDACVEIAQAPVGVLVRDSKNAEGPRLAFGVAGWRTLLAAL
jgi:uncharacterized protein DUF397